MAVRPNTTSFRSDARYNGRDVWGGADSLMLGDVEIARRVGYTRIAFCDREQFLRAIREDQTD